MSRWTRVTGGGGENRRTKVNVAASRGKLAHMPLMGLVRKRGPPVSDFFRVRSSVSSAKFSMNGYWTEIYWTRC